MQKQIFEINKNIYSENLVIERINIFKDIAKISYDNGNLTIESNNNEDIDEIFNEFMNYVVFLYNDLI